MHVLPGQTNGNQPHTYGLVYVVDFHDLPVHHQPESAAHVHQEWFSRVLPLGLNVLFVDVLVGIGNEFLSFHFLPDESMFLPEQSNTMLAEIR